MIITVAHINDQYDGTNKDEAAVTHLESGAKISIF